MKDKVVLVTGANGGLGASVTQALLDAGATVIGLARKIEQSEFSSSNFTALRGEISTASGAKAAIDASSGPLRQTRHSRPHRGWLRRWAVDRRHR